MQDRLAMKFDFSLDAVQLRLAAVLAVVGAVAIGWVFRADCGYSTLPQVDPDRVERARQFIDLNIDDYASLRRLPGVGDVKARDIIAYRNACENPPAFRKPEDLMKISGIGPGTLREARPMIKINPE